MKKVHFFLILAIVLFNSCRSKHLSDAEALVAYQQMTQDVEAFLQQEGVDEQKADSALHDYVDRALELAVAHPNTDVYYSVLEDLYFFYSTEQKQTLFARVDTALLAERNLMRRYRSFCNECQTAVGMTYTDFSAPTLGGDTLALSSLVGKTSYVLVDFWASWCGPCRMSMPAMKQVYEHLDGRLQILGVSLDNNHDKWEAAIVNMQLPWLHISDLQGWGCVPADMYGVCSIPATVLIDSTGTIVARNAEPEQIQMICNR